MEQMGVTIIESEGVERQLITCNVCEYKDQPGYCDFCRAAHSMGLPHRIHVPEIRIVRMNRRIMNTFGKPIYTQG